MEVIVNTEYQKVYRGKRGKRSNLFVFDGILFATPYRKGIDCFCSMCDKKLTIQKDMNEVCECGAIINWLSFIHMERKN